MNIYIQVCFIESLGTSATYDIYTNCFVMIVLAMFDNIYQINSGIVKYGLSADVSFL